MTASISLNSLATRKRIPNVIHLLEQGVPLSRQAPTGVVNSKALLRSFFKEIEVLFQSIIKIFLKKKKLMKKAMCIFCMLQIQINPLLFLALMLSFLLAIVLARRSFVPPSTPRGREQTMN